jgi:hypothetical protein
MSKAEQTPNIAAKVVNKEEGRIPCTRLSQLGSWLVPGINSVEHPAACVANWSKAVPRKTFTPMYET